MKKKFKQLPELGNFQEDDPKSSEKNQILIDLHVSSIEMAEDIERDDNVKIDNKDILQEIINIILINVKSYKVLEDYLKYFGDNKKAFKFIYIYKNLYKALYMFLTKQDDINNEDIIDNTIGVIRSYLLD